MALLQLTEITAKWHYIFPLDGQEVFVGRDGKRTTRVFDAAWCTRLAESYGEYMALSAAAGATPQPMGVCRHHVIADSVRGKELQDDETLRRIGNIYGVHFEAQASEGRPAGVYALIQWNDTYVDTGLPFLSPTTYEPTYTMSSGARIQGPFLFEIATVAQPKLETIGLIGDAAPWSTFPLPSWVAPPEPAPAQGVNPAEMFMIRSHFAEGELITRSATMIEEPPMDPATDPAAQVATATEPATEPAVPSLSIEELVTRMCDEMERRGYVTRAAAAPTVGTEPATSPADPASATSDEELATRALVIFDAEIANEVEELAKGKRLVPGRVQEYMTARRKGEPVAHLLIDGDWSKVAGSAVNPTPAAPAAPASTDPAELLTRARRECEGKTERDVLARYHELASQAQTR